MIERALRELNENNYFHIFFPWFIEGEYGDFPWAHSALLNHHLQELCESNFIAATRGNKYMLVGVNHGMNSSSESKRNGSVERKPKRRWDSESKRQRQQRDQLNVIDKQQFTEIGVNREENQVEGYGAIMRSQSCSDGKISRVDGDSTFLPTRPLGAMTWSGNKYSEAMPHQQGTCPSGIMNASMEEREQGKRPPGFESVRVENLSNSGVDWIYEQGFIVESAECFLDLPSGNLSNEARPELLIPERPIDVETAEPLEELGTLWDQHNTPDLTTIWDHQELKHLREDVVTETKHEGIETYSLRGENGGAQKPEIALEDVSKLEQLEELPVDDLLQIITTLDTRDPSLTLIQPQSQQSIKEEPRFLYRLHQGEILEMNQPATNPMDKLHERWREEELDVAKDEISANTLQLGHQPKLKPDFKASKNSSPSVCQKLTEVNQQRYFLEPQICERRQERSAMGNFIEHQRDTEQQNQSADCRAHNEKVEVVDKAEDLMVHSDFVSISEQKLQVEEQPRHHGRGGRPKKRRRGRPSKAKMESVVVERVQSAKPRSPDRPKRGRGRPAKAYQETFRFNIDDLVY